MRWLKLTSLKIRGWVLVNANLMLFSTFSLFLCFVFKWRSIENPLSQRYVDTKGTKTRKASNVMFVYEWYIPHQNCVSRFSLNKVSAAEPFRKSKNSSCNSSGMLATSREAENWLRVNVHVVSSFSAQGSNAAVCFQEIRDAQKSSLSNFYLFHNQIHLPHYRVSPTLQYFQDLVFLPISLLE